MKPESVFITIAMLMFGFAAPVYADIHLPEVSWTTLYSRQGILVEKGSVAGSPYHALRGTGIVQTNIGRVISILYDHTRANEWVDRLVESRGLRDLRLSSVVWQRFSVPWPADDRNFVYLASPFYDENKKYFQALMSDISDTSVTLTATEISKIGDQSCCTMGKLIYGHWQFRPTGLDSTCARVEVLFDPRGRLPAYVVNQFQKNWPFATIEGLQAQALKQDINLHPVFGHWTADHPETMIEASQCRDGQMDG